jgi:tetratricopeptide (TPR) repeat protein
MAEAAKEPEKTPPGRQPLSPAKRRQLQQCFEQGAKVSATGNFDYATEMYSVCVLGDPANPIYVKSFLANLQKKYNNNKTGSKLAGVKGMSLKGGIKTAGLKKDWSGVIKQGLDMLKLNPWDASTLTAIASACEQLEYQSSQLEYLRMALDGDINEPNINRIAGRALGDQGEFDEAVRCWARVLKAKPGDEEAMRAMNDLSVKKTIKKGGYEDAESAKDVRASKLAAADNEERLTPEQQLERAIAKNPADMGKYIELYELYQRDERYKEGEEVLTRAMAASGGGDMQIRERLEDVQIRKIRQQLQIAEQKAREEKTDAAVELYKRIKTELNNKEIEVYTHRSDRNPANLGFKYELAVRLMRAGKFTEAIKLFQEARGDLKRKGQVFMNLGQCFAQIKQYKLSLTNFEQAVENISEKDADLKKEALYLAGKLAVHLKDVETADKHLSALASLDFGYKDLSEWLDKLNQLREDSGESLDE